MNDPLDVEAARNRDTERTDQSRAQKLAADTDFLWVMSDQRGRRTMWRQLSDAGIFRSSFAPDPSVMAFNEGNRQAGLKLLDRMLRVCPAEYLLMQKENTSVDPQS